MLTLDKDSSWPLCVPCGAHDRWCAHVADRIRNNADVLDVEKDSGHVYTMIAVPFLPDQGVFAWVGWDDEVAPGTRMMWLAIWQPFADDMDFTKEYIGMWSEGERRASICLAVRDWVRGQTIAGHLPCPFGSHNYRMQQQIDRFDESQHEVNDFYVLVHSSCFFCYKKMNSIGQASPDNFLDPPDDSNTTATLGAIRNNKRIQNAKVPF